MMMLARQIAEWAGFNRLRICFYIEMRCKIMSCTSFAFRTFLNRKRISLSQADGINNLLHIRAIL